jgi:hypothetical protein
VLVVHVEQMVNVLKAV